MFTSPRPSSSLPANAALGAFAARLREFLSRLTHAAPEQDAGAPGPRALGAFGVLADHGDRGRFER